MELDFPLPLVRLRAQQHAAAHVTRLCTTEYWLTSPEHLHNRDFLP